jgi:hypothetical protein
MLLIPCHLKQLVIFDNFILLNAWYLIDASMKKYILLLFVLLLNLNYGICQKNPFENEILAFEKSDSIQTPPENSNLFVGSSQLGFGMPLIMISPITRF